jgi:hypothetical protein
MIFSCLRIALAMLAISSPSRTLSETAGAAVSEKRQNRFDKRQGRGRHGTQQKVADVHHHQHSVQPVMDLLGQVLRCRRYFGFG